MAIVVSIEARLILPVYLELVAFYAIAAASARWETTPA